jgi:hypothetical protein
MLDCCHYKKAHLGPNMKHKCPLKKPHKLSECPSNNKRCHADEMREEKNKRRLNLIGNTGISLILLFYTNRYFLCMIYILELFSLFNYSHRYRLRIEKIIYS